MDDITHAVALHDQSNELHEAGDQAGAEEKCREALAIFEREEGPESPDVANILQSLGTILVSQGKYDEGVECARRAVAIIEPLLPAFDGDDGQLILLHCLGLLGTALREKGAYREAESHLLRAIEMAELLPGHPDELVNALNNFGILCKFAGWFDRGEQAYSRAIAIAEPLFGTRHELVATLLHNIGGLDHARGQYGKAEEPSRKAWEIRRELLGDDHPQTLADAVAYAGVLDGLERYEESRPIYERALAIYERLFGPEHYEVAAALHNLAAVEHARGNGPHAIALMRRTLDIKNKLFGPDHPDTALSAMNLGAMLLDENRDTQEGAALSASALATFERTLAPDHPHTVACRQLVTEATTRSTEDPG